MNIKIYIFGILMLLVTACSNEGTLDQNYWETRESGAYKFTSAKVLTYSGGVLVSDVSLNIGKSYILLETTPVLGFYNDLKNFGPFGINFGGLNVNAWNMENDSKRMTLTRIVGSSDQPLATLTIDNIGEASQTWHYVQTNASVSSYIHTIYEVERTTSPN
jgi:hypothetical protein